MYLQILIHMKDVEMHMPFLLVIQIPHKYQMHLQVVYLFLLKDVLLILPFHLSRNIYIQATIKISLSNLQLRMKIILHLLNI